MAGSIVADVNNAGLEGQLEYLAQEMGLQAVRKLLDGLGAKAMTESNTMPEEVEPRFRNLYFHCGREWQDEWSSMCNDRCPVCNAEIEPCRSEEIGQGVREVKALDAAEVAWSPATTTAVAGPSYSLRINGPTLREQRLLLERFLDSAGLPRHGDDRLLLEGIIEMLDTIADQARDQHGIDCLIDAE